MRVQHWFYTIPLRLRSIFRRRQVEQDLDEELQYHLDKKVEELLSRGLDPAEARNAALRAMDGLAQRKEECRDARRVNLIDNAIQDLRYGVRVLAKAPGFTAVAVLTLALGIGANTAIFSVIDAVLLKPLNHPDPDRIVQLMLFATGRNANTASLLEFNIYRERREVFDQIAAYDTVKGINLTGIDPPEQLRRMLVSFDYFSLFGAHTVLGRTFTEQEDRPGGPHVAVISQELRNRRFASEDPIGKVLTLGDDAYTVIGVLDTSFVEGDAPDLFLPLQADPLSTNGAHDLKVAARLKPGVTLAKTKAALRLAHEEFVRSNQNFPNTSLAAFEGFTAEPRRETIVGESRRPLLVLAGAVGLVLLIACANVANLLIARNTGRQREIAVRAALGAGRGRIASQLLAESLLLSLSGGALGLLVGTLAIRALMAMRPGHIPRIEGAVALDPAVLLFTLVLAISTGLLFGMAPALTSVTRLNDSATLIARGVRSSVSRGQKRARSFLVIAEIALALVLLTGAGLLIRTFWALRTVDPGFDAHNVLTMEMSVEGTRFETPAAVARLISDAESRLRNLPGVVAAAAAFSLPLYDQMGGQLTIRAHPDDRYSTNYAFVSKGYFDAFRIPLRTGRFLNEWDDEDSPPVAIANEAMAKGHSGGLRSSSTTFPWRDGSPIGERITIGPRGPGANQTREIVGVAGAVRDSGLNRNPLPLFYLPISQMTEAQARRNSRGRPLHWVVRTKAEPYSLRADIERELRAASGGLPVAHIRSMEEVLSEATARDRFNMTLLSAFAALALMLGAVGVYGVMAYTVQQRTQEIGVRIALGALPRDVRFMVVFYGMRLAVAGVVLGAVVALTVTPLMESLLFGVEARDPAVFASTVIVLSTAVLLATCIPAYRATRVDPVTALRWE